MLSPPSAAARDSALRPEHRDGVGQVVGVTGDELDAAPVGWVPQCQPVRVQPLPGQPQPFGEHGIRAVEPVADARVPDGRHMHADLMGAAGLEADVKQACGAKSLDRVVMGDTRPSARDHGEPAVPGGVAADRRIHGATQRVGMALDERVITLFHRALAGQYPPGSTFKLVTGIGALEERTVTRNTKIDCNGGLRIPNPYNPGASTDKK